MQMSRLVCLGLSHQTAGVELRECVSGPHLFAGRDPAVEEVVVVSTCNRVELYAYLAADVVDGEHRLLELLAHAHKVEPSALETHTYYYSGVATVEHLCRVATGLESLVLGEPQILGQIGTAYQEAQAAQQAGPYLALLFRIGIEAGKRARRETAISTNPASISSVAIVLAQAVTGDLAARRVLVVGLGEMGRLTVKTLRSRNVGQIDLANRTVAKAEVVAAAWGGTSYSLDELAGAIAPADVVFTAASSPAPLIDAALVERSRRTHGERPLVLVDLAVPRNINPDVTTLAGVHLFDVDDLRGTLDEALSARQREVPSVEAIIAEALAQWERQVQELAIKPVILDLRQKAERIRQRELARTMRFLGDVDPQVLAHVQHLSRALVNQLLHEPTIRLKEKATAADADEYAETFRELFGLEREAEILGD
jgi:glutamyl-tRNA reductase